MGPDDITNVSKITNTRKVTDVQKVTSIDELVLDDKCSYITVNDPNVVPDRFRRSPPGPGAYTEAEYEDWGRLHPKSILYPAGPWEPESVYSRYNNQWFWDRGYYYAGSMYGGYRGAIMEIWLSNKGDGTEIRLFRGPRKKVPSDNSLEYVEKERKPPEHLIEEESAALEEAEVYARDYIEMKNYFVERSKEVKELHESKDYAKIYQEFLDEVNDFQNKYNYIMETRIPELEIRIVSQDGARKMADLTNILDPADFSKWRGEGIVELFRDLPPLPPPKQNK